MTRVLIVEDEESFADPLAFLLRKEGFTAAVASTGQQALEEFDRNGADIVQLDLMLPGMSGTDVCKALRQRSAVPVIMVTARDSEIDKVVGLEIGADDYVTKPYSARERATGGTGLGLAIVKHVAANHGGEVKLWSRLGTGSTFTIRVPKHGATSGDGHAVTEADRESATASSVADSADGVRPVVTGGVR